MAYLIMLAMKEIREEGQMGASTSVSSMIILIVGVAIAVLIMIFVGALSGQTYNLVESDLDSIADATINASVRSAITSGFEALEQTGNYLPLLVLAVITALVIGLVLSFGSFTGGDGRGSVL
jgi:flagellar biosynthesis protein FlhB